MTFILVLTCLFTPLNIAFDFNEHSTFTHVLDYVIDFIYFLDIIIIFNSAYYNEEQTLIVSHKEIACRYVKGWFFVDVLSIVPFAIFLD